MNMDIHIREVRDGRITSDGSDLTVVDAVVHQRGSTSEESEQCIVSLSWEQDYAFTSTVTLEYGGNHPEGELFKALTKDLFQTKQLIRKLYLECGMMLLNLSVSPLKLTIQHQASDAFRKYQKKMSRILKKFLFFYMRTEMEWRIRITRLSSNRASIKHVDDRNRSLRNNTVAEKTHIQERISYIKKEMADLKKLFEEHSQMFQEEHKLHKSIIAKIIDSFQNSFGNRVGAECMSKDSESSLENKSAITEQKRSDEHIERYMKTRQAETNTDRKSSMEALNSVSALRKKKESSTNTPSRTNTQQQTAENGFKSTKVHQTARQTSGKETSLLNSEEDAKGDKREGSTKFSHTKVKPGIRIPHISYKTLPREKVDDYREASREWGVSKDDSQMEGEDGRSSILESLVQRFTQPLRAEVRKHKLDSTKCAQTSIKDFLKAFPTNDEGDERADLWEGVMETMKSEERMREEGLDTIVCIHSSYGLDERAFRAVEEFVLALLVGLENQSKTHGLTENVGLIETDDERPVIHHLTDDINAVKDTLKGLSGSGSTTKMKIRPSSLNKTLLLGIGALSKAGICTFGELTILPRMFILTDGLRGDISSPKQASLRSALRALGSDHIRKTLVNPSVWIPIGKGNQESIRKMVELSNGTLFDNIHSLISYQNIKRVSADVLAYMRSDANSDVSHLEEVLDDVGGKKLSLEDQRRISHFVAHKLTKMPRELCEIDNFDNVNISDNLPHHGSRVVRGPDWKYNNQDSGLPGTVVNHDGERVLVKWDNRMYGSYGYSSSCGFDVITTDKEDYQIQLLDIGRKVTRGPHWCHGNEDGGSGSTGVIIRAKRGFLKVRWENGNIHNYRFDSDVFEIWTKCLPHSYTGVVLTQYWQKISSFEEERKKLIHCLHDNNIEAHNSKQDLVFNTGNISYSIKDKCRCTKYFLSLPICLSFVLIFQSRGLPFWIRHWKTLTLAIPFAWSVIGLRCLKRS